MIIISIYATNLIILSSIMIIFDIINLFINLVLTNMTKKFLNLNTEEKYDFKIARRISK